MAKFCTPAVEQSILGQTPHMHLYEAGFKAMGSPCSLSLYCHSQGQFEQLAKLCIAELERLEQQYSRYRSNSLLSQINAAAGTKQRFALDDEFIALLQYADMAFQISEGLFDITSGVLARVWDFSRHQAADTDQINDTLTRVGWQKLPLSRRAFYLPVDGMALDLGGIVKEYAADLLAKRVTAHGIKHGYIDLGGDIAVVGPHPDNSPWRVAIKNPQSPAQAIATIPMMSGGLASSGDYERFIELNGQRYSHILNPKTGWPVKGLAAVSVWAPQCIIAGTLATTAMLMGERPGIEWLGSNDCQYVAVDQHMQVTASQER